MTTLKIDKMPLAERLAVMEQLWDSFVQKPEVLPSPSWHREVLTDRRKKMAAGQAKFTTLVELRKQLSR